MIYWNNNNNKKIFKKKLIFKNFSRILLKNFELMISIFFLYKKGVNLFQQMTGSILIAFNIQESYLHLFYQKNIIRNFN